MRNLRWKNPLESTMEIQGDDFANLKKTAGHSYKLTVLKEGGAVPLCRSLKANIIVIVGTFLLGALIFYQSLFVSEIRVSGYRSISEENIRQVIADAGLYEGVRKPSDYNNVKEAIYNEFENITWVSVYVNGRLVEINVAEASSPEDTPIPDNKPTNIVASQSGLIEKIIPLTGNACVQKGDYVNKGDVLISGKFEYQSTDYSKGDKIFKLYSHASGQAFAKVPHQLTYYIEKNERIKESTGHFIPGIYLKFGDFEVDTASIVNKYEASVKKEKNILDLIKPLPIKLSLIKVEEVTVREQHRDMAAVESTVEAAIRQYSKENLKQNEKIISKTIDYSENEGTIKADVFIESLEEIGAEKVIKVKKEKKTEADTEADK